MDRAPILLVGLKYVCRYLVIMKRILISDGADCAAVDIATTIQEHFSSDCNPASSRAHLVSKEETEFPN
jgi:hypothetical protein